MAREIVQSALPREACSIAPAAALLVDELVANAVLHGEGPVLLELTVSPPTVRIAVGDACPSTALRACSDPGGLDSTGRGLYLVDSMSSAWGVQPERAGKSVWFELTWS